MLEKPTDSLACTGVALVLIYTDIAMCLWWCVFCFVWYLSAAKEWSTEALEKTSARLHALVWSTSTIPLVLVLISRDIGQNRLTGFCEITSVFLVVVEVAFVSAGCSLGVLTSVALKNVRKALILEGRCPYKLERLILRLGIISFGICAGLFVSLLCNFFENFYVILLKVSAQFASAIFAALWVFSSKTFKSWNKILCPSFRNKGLHTSMPSTKIWGPLFILITRLLWYLIKGCIQYFCVYWLLLFIFYKTLNNSFLLCFYKWQWLIFESAKVSRCYRLIIAPGLDLIFDFEKSIILFA